jgi:RND superfamily putative drug exporter
LALLLLLVKFRSVLIPIEAALGFVLSIGATLGAVVAAFQWGWLRTLFGINVTAPVLSFLPMILIAVLFGLAMDYEVFMVSRIREAFVEMQDPTKSVIEGGRHATRIVTAAALVMFSVFASFVSSQDSTIKAIAFGLAFGVAVDAFIVRMTFVPATLALLGRRSWWLPRWLSRVLPNSEMVGGRIQVVKTELFPNPMPDNDYPGSEPSGAVPGARSGVHGSPRRVRHHPGVQWRLPLSRRIVRRARSGRPAARRQ